MSEMNELSEQIVSEVLAARERGEAPEPHVRYLLRQSWTSEDVFRVAALIRQHYGDKTDGAEDVAVLSAEAILHSLASELNRVHQPDSVTPGLNEDDRVWAMQNMLLKVSAALDAERKVTAEMRATLVMAKALLIQLAGPEAPERLRMFLGAIDALDSAKENAT